MARIDFEEVDVDRLTYDVGLLLGVYGRGSEYDNPRWLKVLDLRYGKEAVDKMIQWFCEGEDDFDE